jgi:hypothetical protein
LLAFADPAFANWWIVRAADEKCLVVDIEPSGNDVTKVGKDVYQTREQAEADVKGLCKELLLPAQETPSEIDSRGWSILISGLTSLADATYYRDRNRYVVPIRVPE